MPQQDIEILKGASVEFMREYRGDKRVVVALGKFVGDIVSGCQEDPGELAATTVQEISAALQALSSAASELACGVFKRKIVILEPRPEKTIQLPSAKT